MNIFWGMKILWIFLGVIPKLVLGVISMYLYLYNTLKSPILAFIQRVGVPKVLVSFIN